MDNDNITSKINGCIITHLALFVKIDRSNKLVCERTLMEKKREKLNNSYLNSIIYNYLTWCWHSNSTRPVIIQVC